jgi:DNA-directed RNA polymerase specialized sigma24 family protein
VGNKTLELLENADWKRIIPELTQYALSRLRLKFFEDNSPLNGSLPIDIAEDVVMESIRKVLDDTRSWKPDEKDNLVIHLKSVIKSGISHLDDDKEHKTTERFPPKTGSNDGQYVEELLKKAHPLEEHTVGVAIAPPLDPEESLEEKERFNRDKIMEEKIMEKVNHAPELADVVLCIMMGLSRPRDIAAELGIPVKEVNNRQKRLRRIYKDLCDRRREEA